MSTSTMSPAHNQLVDNLFGMSRGDENADEMSFGSMTSLLSGSLQPKSPQMPPHSPRPLQHLTETQETYREEENTMVEEDFAFTSNGLLAGKESSQTETTTDGSSIATPASAFNEVDQPLVSNGLLSSSMDEDDDNAILNPRLPILQGQGISRNPARIPIKVTTFDGKNFELRRKRKVGTPLPTLHNIASASSARPSRLLEVPIHRLMEEISVTVAQKLTDEHVASATTPVRSTPQSTLWVDRYRPKRFIDLLGDERTHRETMAWVKCWDTCVFGTSKSKGKKRARDEDDGEPTIDLDDPLKRPTEKLLLLSGPPGLGKTTLAHVVAKQAGYDVLEINASDARSGQAIDDRIRPALESGSLIGSSKPVLVVIDEIDGATGGGDNTGNFIHKLLQMAFEKRPRKGAKKSANNANRPLVRPIICICNDLYSSSLTRLRQQSRIVRFNRAADVHLVRRLREICEKESLSIDTHALNNLVNASHGDIRGCLNALQFIKSRNQPVTEPMIRAATAGMKESESSFLNVLTDIFTPLSKKRAKAMGIREIDESKYVDRLQRLIDGSGSTDKVALGCFENYLNYRQHDISKLRKAISWLCAYDAFSGGMRSEREYGLLGYVSYFLVPFYPVFAARGGPRIEMPKVDWENFQRTKTNEEIYKSLAKGNQADGVTNHRPPHLRHLLEQQVLRLELAPLLNRIISPPLRPVNNQIIKADDKARLNKLVETMLLFDLRFVQEKTEDGSLTYRLDPAIDVFVTYEGKRAPDIAPSRYATRHMVAIEIEAELAKRQAQQVAFSEVARPSMFGRRPKTINDMISSLSDGTIAIDPADKPPTDFFGRPILIKPTPSVTTAAKNTEEAPQKKYKVGFRFKEGNSSAVRRPVKVAALL
ncbi:hypothetical protein SISNIDRAFT_479953 [Sistotremastrum niveocremeum HHB9708]|uniref:AAA+ ATPase domain-containing protein n=2 Tax=Sistotremastraceae TaxID=3402574 RepID=A0A164P555_9AGAM|nr:hypothetical protein SISNIDRAFT_479953 [Sistotremastrum niveocremeum HHB9708]KZT39710.1 hypothetical protein SISSUDRAFT_1118783 [Sistotremastrum suecicum HHB10207 ss-3]